MPNSVYQASAAAAPPGGEVAEKFIHQAFADDRLHGEWFRYSDRLGNLASGQYTLTLDGRLICDSPDK